MKIEVEDMCDGLFVVFQEDEGVVNSVVLSTANIVALVHRAFPEEVSKYWSLPKQAMAKRTGGLRLVEGGGGSAIG